jgi:hypothetical protein
MALANTANAYFQESNEGSHKAAPMNLPLQNPKAAGQVLGWWNVVFNTRLP